MAQPVGSGPYFQTAESADVRTATCHEIEAQASVAFHAGVCTDDATGKRYFDWGFGIGGGVGVVRTDGSVTRHLNQSDTDIHDAFAAGKGTWTGRLGSGTTKGLGTMNVYGFTSLNALPGWFDKAPSAGVKTAAKR